VEIILAGKGEKVNLTKWFLRKYWSVLLMISGGFSYGYFIGFLVIYFGEKYAPLILAPLMAFPILAVRKHRKEKEESR